MAHYVYIRAYGLDATTADSGPIASSPPELGSPHNLYAILDGADVDVEWDYTYVPGDDLQGFRVYIGYNPMPQWNEATDTGMAGGDSGYPTEHFTVPIPNTWYGQVYVCVQAYSGDPDVTTQTATIGLMLPPRSTTGAQIDAPSDTTLRWATDLYSSTRASQEPALELRGIPIGAIIEQGVATILDTTDSIAVAFTDLRTSDYVVTNYATTNNGGGALWVEDIDAGVGFTIASTASVSSDTDVNWCVIRAMERTV
jgi:hypothetical protein